MPPSGPVKTSLPGGNAGVEWEDVTQYDDAIHAAADSLGWAIERIRAHILIESRGNDHAVQTNSTNGNSYGLLQIVPYGVGWAGWSDLVRQKAGLPKSATKQEVINALYNPKVNIAVGVQILENFYKQYGTADKASSAFFLGNPDWRGADTVNGNTGKQYRDALNGLIAEQKAMAPVDPIAVIVGGDYPPIMYGWLADGGLEYYSYGVGHGTTKATQHTGVDVPVTCGTRLYSPITGVVDCVGSAGTPRWGQGCGAYADVDGGGIGNITIYGDSGHKLTLGHCHTASVRPGQRVVAGQQVGTSGSMNGCHCHVEVSVLRNGTYWLLEPIAALTTAMGGIPITPAPPVITPNIVPQPSEFDVWVEVTALRDNIPVLQRADLNAPQTKPPLKKGDVFNAVYQVVGNDKRIYWISTLGNRVPVEGTISRDWGGVIALCPECPPTPALALSQDDLAAIRHSLSELDIYLGN